MSKQPVNVFGDIVEFFLTLEQMNEVYLLFCGCEEQGERFLLRSILERLKKSSTWGLMNFYVAVCQCGCWVGSIGCA